MRLNTSGKADIEHFKYNHHIIGDVIHFFVSAKCIIYSRCHKHLSILKNASHIVDVIILLILQNGIIYR